MTDIIPFAFDADFYRSAYPDLSHLTPQAAAEHFQMFGVSEGRLGIAQADRDGFLQRVQALDSVLEVGPFCNPILRGDNVRYLDVFDATELHRRATAYGLNATGCPPHIHYVGDMSCVDEMFDGVVSSHAIEHQPDLIGHLEGVARILRPVGRYYLLVPDKRYCFDHYLPESTVGEVIQAHEENWTTHSMKSVIDHYAMTTHNDSTAHWRGEHGERYRSDKTARIEEAMSVYRSTPGYIDVHGWCFTPNSFWDLMNTLHGSGRIQLRPVEIHSTARNCLEFYAVLQRD